MINCVRSSYLVKTNDLKLNNKPLNSTDYLNVGYMAGRFGVNLSNNPYEQNPIQLIPEGTLVSINSCCNDTFEKNLNGSGIKFNRIA